MHLRHETSLLSTTLPLWTYIITLGKQIDDEKTLLLKTIGLYRFLKMENVVEDQQDDMVKKEKENCVILYHNC